MENNCLNCMKSKWTEDLQTGRMRRRCIPNGMWVNRRMTCGGGQWPKPKPFVGAMSVSGITTEKRRYDMELMKTCSSLMALVISFKIYRLSLTTIFISTS